LPYPDVRRRWHDGLAGPPVGRPAEAATRRLALFTRGAGIGAEQRPGEDEEDGPRYRGP
jgi:hypothetical protein